MISLALTVIFKLCMTRHYFTSEKGLDLLLQMRAPNYMGKKQCV